MRLTHIKTPRRIMAPFRWYGGKGLLAKKIVPHIPMGDVYVEPYCGAASIFWHKTPTGTEVLNDFNKEIINLFRVLQNREMFKELQHRLIWTPYSFEEFKKARRIKGDTQVDKAWAFFVKVGQGFNGQYSCDGDWAKSRCERAGNSNGWRGRLKMLRVFHDRLTRVQLDCRCALEVIKYWDSFETVFYLDPPYVADTRAIGSTQIYEHECEDTHHKKLVDTLLRLKGKAVLSGYRTPVYEPLEKAGWGVIEFQVFNNCSNGVREPRTEVIWIKNKTSKQRHLREIGRMLKNVRKVRNSRHPRPKGDTQKKRRNKA